MLIGCKVNQTSDIVLDKINIGHWQKTPYEAIFFWSKNQPMIEVVWII